MKKVLRIVMAFILVQAAFFSVLPVNAAANDISGHWAQAQITDWMEKGLIKGYTDGTFKPDNSISRAECFAMINRAFGFTQKSAEAFEDVDQKWYAEDIAKARAQGYLKGYTDNTARPDKPITRQEIIAIIARILKLNPDEAALSVYPDAKSVTSWARGSVGAVSRLGYFNVYEDKSLRPDKNATRAEIVWMLAKAAGTMYNAKGIYGQEKDTQVINGNVTISGSDVTLRNTTIKGNLYLSEGIAGRAVLENVTVEGVTTLCGAPASLNGKFGRLLIEARKAQVSINGGTVSELTINADGCEVSIRDTVSVTTLNINKPVRVSGKCTIGTANINADNVTVEANPSVVNVGANRKGVSVTAAAPVAIITGGNTGGNPGGNTGGNPGGNTGDNPGGNTGDNPGGNTGDNPGGNTGDNPGGDTGGDPDDGTTTPTAITVTGMDTIPDINAAYGTSPGAITLPSSVTLQLSNSTTTAAGITAWDTTAFVPNKSGTYTFTGTLALPDGISNPDTINPAVHLNIGVQPELIADSYVVKGQAVDMPETVTVRLDEITTAIAGINWDLAGFSTNTLGSFPLRGTLVMPEGTSDPAGTTVSMVMRVTDPIADPNPGTSMVLSQGTEINECDEMGANLTFENAVVELDTTNKVSGSGSLRITSNVPLGGGNIAITNRVNMNLSAMKNLQFDVYIPDKSQLDGISLRLYNNRTANFSRYTGSWRLVNGWNRITVAQSDFLVHDGADWSNAITSIVVTFCANSGCKPCVNLDAMAYNVSAKTNILFTFDDGWYDLIDGSISGNAYSCLKEKGLTATVWAKKISSAYGGNTHVTVEEAVNDTGHPKYMNETDLTMLYNEGWDIGNHTVNHYDSISGLSDEQILREYQECQQWLIDRSWTRGAYFAAYPSGVYNERLIEQLRSVGVLAARTTAYGLQSVPVDNMYKLKCISLDTTLTRDAAMAVLRSEIDRAVETGTTLIFMLHKVEDSADPLAITTAEFRSIVDYVDARRSNINVLTFSEWYNAYVDAAVTAVTPLQDIECDVGTDAGSVGLPSQVEIRLGDTRTAFVPVTWDTSGYDATKAGTYPITGMLQLPYGIANSSGLTANVNVILKDTSAPAARNITTIAAIDLITVDAGTTLSAIALPAQVQVTLDDASTEMLNVSWNPDGYNGETPGTYTLTGEIVLPEGITNDNDIKAQIQITVCDPAPAARNITTIAAIDLITVDAGTTLSAIALPAQVQVTLDDASTEMLNVNWNMDGYNSEVPGTYTLMGTLQLPEGITNSSNLTVTVNVTVMDTPAPAVRNITTIAAIDLITVDTGTTLSAITLPAQVQVTLDDTSSEMLNVNWNPDGYNGETPETYTLTGEIVLPEGITNNNDIKAQIQITVCDPIPV